MDLQGHSEEEVVDLVRQRYQGIQLLRSLLGDQALQYEAKGSVELFLAEHTDLRDQCLEGVDRLNELLMPVFGDAAFRVQTRVTGFQGTCPEWIEMPQEGQLNPAAATSALASKADSLGVRRLQGLELLDFKEEEGGVLCRCGDWEFLSGKLCLATNGFAHRLFPSEVEPARAQVLITEPLGSPPFRGSFHIDRGYTYFRAVGDRILLGGGRHLALEDERTVHMNTSPLIQDYLDRLLREVILPGRHVGVDRRWSGIMGIGPGKRPLLKTLGRRTFAAVRLGGMGVALGTSLGFRLAERAA